MDTIPRRIRIDLMTPAELAIRNAMLAVEEAGCDVRLTDAVILLQQASERVADFVDGVAALHKEGAGGEPNEIDLVRAVLCAHQTAFAKAHNGEGRSMMEAENIAIGYASVELAKLLVGRASPAGRAEPKETK